MATRFCSSSLVALCLALLFLADHGTVAQGPADGEDIPPGPDMDMMDAGGDVTTTDPLGDTTETPGDTTEYPGDLDGSTMTSPEGGVDPMADMPEDGMMGDMGTGSDVTTARDVDVAMNNSADTRSLAELMGDSRADGTRGGFVGETDENTGLMNVAEGKQVLLSSVLEGTDPVEEGNSLVEGLFDESGACTETSLEDAPYMTVDLGEPYYVRHVQLLTSDEVLSDLVVYVESGPERTVCAEYADPVGPNTNLTIFCNHEGETVTVMRNDTATKLHMCEIGVFGDPIMAGTEGGDLDSEMTTPTLDMAPPSSDMAPPPFDMAPPEEPTVPETGNMGMDLGPQGGTAGTGNRSTARNIATAPRTNEARDLVPPPSNDLVPPPSNDLVPPPSNDLVPPPSNDLVPPPSNDLVPPLNSDFAPPLGGSTGPAPLDLNVPSPPDNSMDLQPLPPMNSDLTLGDSDFGMGDSFSFGDTGTGGDFGTFDDVFSDVSSGSSPRREQTRDGPCMEPPCNPKGEPDMTFELVAPPVRTVAVGPPPPPPPPPPPKAQFDSILPERPREEDFVPLPAPFRNTEVDTSRSFSSPFATDVNTGSNRERFDRLKEQLQKQIDSQSAGGSVFFTPNSLDRIIGVPIGPGSRGQEPGVPFAGTSDFGSFTNVRNPARTRPSVDTANRPVVAADTMDRPSRDPNWNNFVMGQIPNAEATAFNTDPGAFGDNSVPTGNALDDKLTGSELASNAIVESPKSSVPVSRTRPELVASRNQNAERMSSQGSSGVSLNQVPQRRMTIAKPNALDIILLGLRDNPPRTETSDVNRNFVTSQRRESNVAFESQSNLAASGVKAPPPPEMAMASDNQNMERLMSGSSARATGEGPKRMARHTTVSTFGGTKFNELGDSNLLRQVDRAERTKVKPSIPVVTPATSTRPDTRKVTTGSGTGAFDFEPPELSNVVNSPTVISTGRQTPVASRGRVRPLPREKEPKTPKVTSISEKQFPNSLSSLLMTEELPDGEEICKHCQYINGLCYLKREGFCNRFIECSNLGLKVRAFEKECTFGAFWDQDNLACSANTQAKCLSDPCLEKDVSNHTYYGYCRAYWTCSKQVSSSRCCAKNYGYNPAVGRNGECVPMPECVADDYCLSPFEIEEKEKAKPPPPKCPLEPHPTNRFKFKMGDTYVECGFGTVFNVDKCTCTKSALAATITEECERDVLLDFEGETQSALRDKSGQGSTVETSNISIVNGAAQFYNKGQIILWRYSNIILGTSFAITFRFKPFRGPGAAKEQVLLSNCDENNNNAAIDIRLDTSRSKVTFKLSTDEVPGNKITLDYEPFVWNNVALLYDGNSFIAGINEEFEDKFAHGEIPKKHPPLVMGGCGRPSQTRLQDTFYGFIDDVSIYSCVPDELRQIYLNPLAP